MWGCSVNNPHVLYLVSAIWVVIILNTQEVISPHNTVKHSIAQHNALELKWLYFRVCRGTTWQLSEDCVHAQRGLIQLAVDEIHIRVVLCGQGLLVAPTCGTVREGKPHLQ